MIIIDAHMHVFPRLAGRTSGGPVKDIGFGHALCNGKDVLVMPQPNSKHTRVSPDAVVAMLDSYSIDHAVLLQGPFYGPCDDYARNGQLQFPNRLTASIYLDPWSMSLEYVKQKLSRFKPILKAECSESTGLCGLYDNAALDDPALTPLWNMLDEYQATLVLDLGGIGTKGYQTHAVRNIAEKYPNIKIVIAHLAQPNLAMASDITLLNKWRQQIDLGKIPNVWFDCSSLPAYANEPSPFPSVSRWVNDAFERIGPSKILWGTDAPSLLTIATYAQLIDLAHLCAYQLSALESEQFFSGNARRCYMIDTSRSRFI